MAESDSEYFGRRREERDAKGKAVLADEQKLQQHWQEKLGTLIAQFDPQIKHLLGAFAEEASEVDSYHIYGPESLGRQVNWRIEYSRSEEGAKRTILVVLRYLQAPETPEQFTPDCFSVEGLMGVSTVRPPTVEALREALGNAGFRR